METLNVVVSEIVLCLVVAWVLGFLAAWILFRKVQNEYEEEIEVLEETLSYSSASNKIQEKELIAQSLKLQEYEKLSKNGEESQNKKKTNKESSVKKSDTKKENKSNDENMLKLIDDNLYTPKKK